MSVKIIQIGTIRKLVCGFLFAFHSNYDSVLHRLTDKASYWSKIVIFSYVRGVPVEISPSPFGVGKLEWWGYPMVKRN